MMPQVKGPDEAQGLGVGVWPLLLQTICMPLEAGVASSSRLVSASVKWEWLK